jgi:hypothetical protein
VDLKIAGDSVPLSNSFEEALIFDGGLLRLGGVVNFSGD